MQITLALKNAKLLLGRIHVLGMEAGLMDGAIKNLDVVIEALEKVEKEAKADDDRNEQRKDV